MRTTTMLSIRPTRPLLTLLPFTLAVLWMACPPPPPPPPPPPSGDTEVKKLGRSEEGLGEVQADGGIGSAHFAPDGGVVTPTSVHWCSYLSTGPSNGSECFSGAAHLCIMCPAKGCPQGLAGAYVPNLAPAGKPGKLGCDINFKTTNAWQCGACDSSDDTGGVTGPFGGYFRF